MVHLKEKKDSAVWCKVPSKSKESPTSSLDSAWFLAVVSSSSPSFVVNNYNRGQKQ